MIQKFLLLIFLSNSIPKNDHTRVKQEVILESQKEFHQGQFQLWISHLRLHLPHLSCNFAELKDPLCDLQVKILPRLLVLWSHETHLNHTICNFLSI